MSKNDSHPAEKLEVKTENQMDLNPEFNEEDEKSENDEDGEPPERWDGSEAEIIIDDEGESYEEEDTGIKIKYSLTSDEIRSFVKRSEIYQRNKKVQKKHTVVQSIFFVLMITFAIIFKSRYYAWLSVYAVVFLVLIWLIPVIGVRRIVKKMFFNEEITAEIFTDKIEIVRGGQKREITLDGSCDYEEYDNMIIISSPCDGLSLIIPIRAIEPEFRAEVQAMLLAGSKSDNKEKKEEKEDTQNEEKEEE